MENTVKNILVVEDSKMFAHAIVGKIEAEPTATASLATSFDHARHIIAEPEAHFDGAVVDLVLPDAPNGEVVDYVVQRGIPTIVLTANFSDAVQEKFTARKIVDYIIKEGPHSLDQLISTLRRLEKNRTTKVLIVDDSKAARKAIKDLLDRHQFLISEASNGAAALQIISKHPDIKVVITDYHMPEMDGFELISRIRTTYAMDQMAVIGMSGSGGSKLSAKFLKKGANDFIVKPFSHEEFFLRINQNLQMLDYIDSVREAAVKDHLTKLYNRRYFFEIGNRLFSNARRKSFDIALAMIDIDHFKKVNDTYGHAAGDDVLQHVSALLAKQFRESDIVARLGGEEFCVMAPNMDKDHAFRIFDELRGTIASSPLTTDAGVIGPTISIGLTTTLFDSLEKTLNHADTLLYQAKTEGRNRVVVG